MAGIRKKPQPNGKYVAWFTDANGKQKFFAGTRKRAETLHMAERLEDEHRQVRVGYRPAPKAADKHKKRPFSEVATEYLSWGESQGGRRGHPWSKDHAVRKRCHLGWWQQRLGLERLGDVDGVLPRVEKALRELQEAGRSGKTIQNQVEALKGLFNWCVARGYLLENPLKSLGRFNITPKTRRRAMTVEEIHALLRHCTPEHRLLYEVALCSGLRAGELRALTVKHLDTVRGGLYLDAEWTKNRRSGFQPLPRGLVRSLAEAVAGQDKSALLLSVPQNTSRVFDMDRERAGVAKWLPGQGKVDFHSCRVAYVSFVLQSGATVKEAQSLARHATPDLTMNTYGRTRRDRLAEVAEAVGEAVNPGPDYAVFRTKRAAVAGGGDVTPQNATELRPVEYGGGGGNRTPVP